jgi:hypothetical protein
MDVQYQVKLNPKWPRGFPEEAAATSFPITTRGEEGDCLHTEEPRGKPASLVAFREEGFEYGVGNRLQ